MAGEHTTRATGFASWATRGLPARHLASDYRRRDETAFERGRDLLDGSRFAIGAEIRYIARASGNQVNVQPHYKLLLPWPHRARETADRA